MEIIVFFNPPAKEGSPNINDEINTALTAQNPNKIISNKSLISFIMSKLKKMNYLKKYYIKTQKKLVDLGNDKNTFKRSKMQQNGVKMCSGRNDGNYKKSPCLKKRIYIC